MFTGLVAAVGRVTAIADRDGLRAMTIAVEWPDLVPGESIAVNGACLTVSEALADGFAVEVVATSLGRTTFGERVVGDWVNLERALRLGDRLGGHLVQGHVDAVGTVTAVVPGDGVRLIELSVPPEVADVCIPLGSITVDGVSLTINAIPAPGSVQLAIVPFTLEHTTLDAASPGVRVHLEGDLVGKHVRALAAGWRAEAES